jgi:acyl-CoA thioesterase-1
MPVTSRHSKSSSHRAPTVPAQNQKVLHLIPSQKWLQITLFALASFLTVFSAACQKPNQSSEQSAAFSKPKSSATPAIVSNKSEEMPAIVAFGDSLTAGYGLTNPDEWYTTLLQRRIDENGYRYRVVNAGVSGDTSAGGLRRIDWSLEGNVRFLILELGGNDGLRGLPVAEMKKNLAQTIERAQAREVTVILAGMEAPPNMGNEYTREFRQAFRDLAKQYKTPFIAFFLEGVGGRAEYNQPDGIHPNAEGAKMITENVWRALEPMLSKEKTKEISR